MTRRKSSCHSDQRFGKRTCTKIHATAAERLVDFNIGISYSRAMHEFKAERQRSPRGRLSQFDAQLLDGRPNRLLASAARLPAASLLLMRSATGQKRTPDIKLTPLLRKSSGPSREIADPG